MASKPGSKTKRNAGQKPNVRRRAQRRPKRPEKLFFDDVPQQPDAPLIAVIGARRLTFRQANRKLWRYIQLNGFRSKVDKRMIATPANHPLTTLFGKTNLSMFEMSKLLRAHLT